ncbi:dimethylaniline monooxygenase [Penicillium taxi]|uniref:dimethylaniline monooxygenase n=1 Tax=Penicillium taxi TaxID=168475 RepID=UPI002544EC7D|nr:dimethylaniline monooxygenase [Penicillium taxi]KAJ5893254.1 dimethylaniline monooxygenase [Penicillium taxi]
MAKGSRRVAVIGAGPAGAIATNALLKEQAFGIIRVFERQKIVGGTWVFEPQADHGIPSLESLIQGRADQTVPIPANFPCKTPVTEEINSQKERFSATAAHQNLHSNLPTEIMCFTKEPIPIVLSEQTLAQYGPSSPFRHREVMRNWVESVFGCADNRRLIELETSVELAERVGDEWVLTLRNLIPSEMKNYWWQEKFDALVVASGHYYLPYIPDIPGLVEYDRNFPGRIRHSKHYPSADDVKNKKVIVVGGSVSAFDALHDIRQVAKGPVISSLRRPSTAFGFAPFSHPEIDNRAQISSINAETGVINFADGSVLKSADMILFATGYDFSFPFLPSLKSVHKRIPGIFGHVFKIDDPSLAFIGMVTGGFGIRIFEWQAVAAARVLAGHAKLPSRQEMETWESDRLEEREGSPFWTLMPEFERYFEELRSIAGEPALGTTGRVLPQYEPEWEESFQSFVQHRIERWQCEATKAEAEKAQL